MMSAPVFRVVDSNGLEHGTKMTSEQASAMMGFLLGARPNIQVRSERIDLPISEKTEKVAATPSIAETSPVAVTGQPREALRQAIDDRLDATARLASADDAVDRGRAFLDARQAELDTLSESLQCEIAASGATLAALLKAGAARSDASRLIDRSAVIDATTRRETAKAALEQLEGELADAQKAHTSAETHQRLAVLAVMRTDQDAMVKRLDALQHESAEIRAALDTMGIHNVGLTIEATAVLRNPPVASADVANRRWVRYAAALRDDSTAHMEDIK